MGTTLIRRRSRFGTAMIFAAAVAGVGVSNCVRGQTLASWVNPISGTWSTPSNWSTSPYAPVNGSPAGSSYDVTLPSLSSAYVVTLNSNVTVNQLNVGGASAQLNVLNAGLTASTINISGGATFAIQSGTLSHTTITGGSLTIASSRATPANFDSITIATPVRGLNTRFYDGLTLAGPAGVYTADGTLPDGTTGADTIFLGSQTIAGDGTFILRDDAMSIGMPYPTPGTATLTVAPGVTIACSPEGSGMIQTGDADGFLINKGAIFANENSLSFDGELRWTNQGTFKVSPHGTLRLGGSYSTSDIGTIERSGGTIEVGGSVNNVGQVLEANATTGSLILGGVFTGGTLRSRDGIQFIGSGGILDGVTLDAQIATSSAIFSGALQVRNNLTMMPGSKITSDLKLAGSQSISGTGEVHSVLVDGDVILGAGIVANGGTIGDQDLFKSNRSLISHGTIIASGPTHVGFWATNGSFTSDGTISVGPGEQLSIIGHWTNKLGFLQVHDGTLELGGQFNWGDLGTTDFINPHLTINGTLNNAGTTLTIDSHTGSILLDNDGVIDGGTIVTHDGAQLLLARTGRIGYQLPLLRDVTFDGNATTAVSRIGSNPTTIGISGNLTLLNGARLDLTDAGLNANLAPAGIRGDGEIVVGGSNAINTAYTLTINSGITLIASSTLKSTITGPVLNYGLIRDVSTNAPLLIDGTLVNNGVISADVPASTVRIGSTGKGNFVNNATLQVVDGANMEFLTNWNNANGTIELADGTLLFAGSFNTSAIGAIHRTGGTINLSGRVNNAGATLELDAQTGSYNLLAPGTFTGGTISTTGSARLTMISPSSGNYAALDGATLAGEAVLLGSYGYSYFLIKNGLHLSDGSLTLFSTGSLTQARVDGAIDGSGTLLFGGTNSNNVLLAGSGGSFLIGANVTVRTETQGGRIGYTSGTPTFENRGTIWAGTPGKQIALAGIWSNTGTLRLSDGTLSLGGTFATSNIGSVVRSGGVLVISGSLDNTGATIASDSSWGSIQFGAGAAVTGGTLTGQLGMPFYIAGNATLSDLDLQSDLSALSGARLILKNVSGLLAGHEIRLDGASGQIASILLQGTTSLHGPGTIILAGSGVTSQFFQGSGTLSVPADVLVRTDAGGGGTFGYRFSTVVNFGTLSSESGGARLNIDGTFINQGVVKAGAGGTVSLPSATNMVNYSAGTLTGGTWSVSANSTMTFGTSTITTNNANITLDGASSSFAAINPLQNNLGLFSITNGRNFSSVGSLTNSGTINIGSLTTLTVLDRIDNAAGLIDLNCKMVVDYSAISPLSELVGQIGTHIVSSAANADPSLGIGSKDDGNVVLLQLAKLGDANLDGAVNYTDLVALSQNYSTSSLVGPGWTGGDFNYDGSVNLTDLYALGYQYNDPLNPLPQALQTLGLPVIEVPEPGMMLLFAGMLGGTLRPRKRTWI
jgi:hypothetical protein